MRVEAVQAIPKRPGRGDVTTTDAAASLAMKNFLMAVESEDSLFMMLEPLLGPVVEASETERTYASDVVLGFKQPELEKQRSLQFLLVEKLIELLKEAGSRDTLEARLCLLTQSREDASLTQPALCIRLAAKGDGPEQAILRWGLGLAHLQQALLFTSRHLRQHLAQGGN